METQKKKISYFKWSISILVLLVVILGIYFINNFGRFNYYTFHSDTCGINGYYLEAKDQRIIEMHTISCSNNLFDGDSTDLISYTIKIDEKFVFSSSMTSSEKKEVSYFLQDFDMKLVYDIPKFKKVDGKIMTIDLEYSNQFGESKTKRLEYKIYRMISNNKLIYEKYEM